MKNNNIKKFKIKAKEIRLKTFEMVWAAQKGHMGGSFSCVEIFVSFYYGGYFKFDSSNPFWSERDRFILSKGHSVNSRDPIVRMTTQ